MLTMREQKGFTLIEVMVAMLIAAVVLLALGQMLIVGMRSNQQSEHRMNAAALAQSALADAVAQASLASLNYTSRTVSYTSVPSGQAAITVIPSPPVQGQETKVRVVFTWAEHGTTKTIKLYSYTVTE